MVQLNPSTKTGGWERVLIVEWRRQMRKHSIYSFVKCFLVTSIIIATGIRFVLKTTYWLLHARINAHTYTFWIHTHTYTFEKKHPLFHPSGNRTYLPKFNQNALQRWLGHALTHSQTHFITLVWYIYLYTSSKYNYFLARSQHFMINSVSTQGRRPSGQHHGTVGRCADTFTALPISAVNLLISTWENANRMECPK